MSPRVWSELKERVRAKTVPVNDAPTLWDRNEREERAAMVDGVPAKPAPRMWHPGKQEWVEPIEDVRRAWREGAWHEGAWREGDPTTSVEAALSIRSAGKFLRSTICRTVELADKPLTRFDIEREVLRHHPNRWQGDSIRTAVSHARRLGQLRVLDEEGEHGAGKRKVERFVRGDVA